MEIKVYVANLGKYNEGELVGEWFTLPTELEEIFTTIGVGQYDEEGDYKHGVVELDEKGNSYHYEEWAIHDYEAPFKISEYESLEKLNEIAELLADVDEDQQEILTELVSHGAASDFEEAVNCLDDIIYYHDCKDMSDVAYQWHEETGTDMNGPLMSYIDWERVGRDMDIEGTFIYINSINGYIQYIG
jgi:antirestriction protein